MSRPERPDSRERIEITRTAVVCSDGRILPIVECLGRRVLREIDPGSREGQELLRAGRVQLWSDDGRRVSHAPVEVVVRESSPYPGAAALRHAEIRRWQAHMAATAPRRRAAGRAPARRRPKGRTRD